MAIDIKTKVLGATALALTLAGGAQAQDQDAATRAIEAAREFSGSTITVVAEAGLQALLDKQITGPEFEERTGVKVEIVELPFEEIYPKQILEHQAGSGAYDLMLVAPAWLADTVENGAVVDLQPFIDKYGVPAEDEDINPAFRDYQFYDGKQYGMMVDGDVLVTYYRKDLFEDAEAAAAFKEQYGYDLAPPADYARFGDIACFLTERHAPDIYGAGVINTGYMFLMFSERFRVAGGKFFEPETMRATINDQTAVDVLTQMVEQNACMAPGIETWGFAENLSALNAGQIAMTISWPPLGRWSQGVNIDDEALSWVPPPTVADKVGYAINPGGHPELAVGFMSSVATNSDNKDAAYLYGQWMHSRAQSLKNVMRPVGLRDPFRISHYESPEYQALWPGAKDYLTVLNEGAAQGLADFAWIDTYRYQDAMSRAVIAAISGEDPKEALDALAAEWDALTDEIGVERQRAAYEAWAAKPSAYRDE